MPSARLTTPFILPGGIRLVVEDEEVRFMHIICWVVQPSSLELFEVVFNAYVENAVIFQIEIGLFFELFGPHPAIVTPVSFINFVAPWVPHVHKTGAI